MTFHLRRDQTIFKEVFYSRYSLMTMSELAHLSSEIIELANRFYLGVDESSLVFKPYTRYAKYY